MLSKIFASFLMKLIDTTHKYKKQNNIYSKKHKYQFIMKER